ncbi:neural cell adhesion molecule 1-like isoform X2 [Silurus meridionalis]|nr:neural cell adhesion molecule 1-like isoform X2 [Silurus meridionalis]
MATSTVIITLFFYVFSTVTDATTEAPKVELHATNKDIEVGSEQLLFCKTNKATTFKWQKDGEDIEDNIESDEEKSRLTLKNVQHEDTGKYTCICDFDGDEQEESIHIYVYETPKFVSNKTYYEFLVNETAYIPCEVTGKPEVEINWYWNGLPIANNDTNNLSVLSDGSLQITNIQRQNHGTYVCEGKIKRRPVAKTLNISVVVNVPPSVIVRGESAKVLAGPNNKATLTCLVTGAPHPNISWKVPDTSDSSRYTYNSDKSKLIINGLARRDAGKYVCTAINNFGKDSAEFTLDVTEHPTVTLDKNVQVVKLGDSVSVNCNANGHPTPTVQWLNRNNILPSNGRLRAVATTLQIDNVMPSDGGVYSCNAINEAGKTTQTLTLMTSPDVPTSFTVSPGPAAFHITLQKSIQDGGSPITQYIIQWRNDSQYDWEQTTVPSSGVLKVTSLETYTEYFVRIAAKNQHFFGGFSAEKKIRTLAKREPDIPTLSEDEGKVEKNSYSIPIKLLEDGGSAVTHYIVRYRKNKESEAWREKEADANSSSIHLQNLEYDSNYEAEISAVNTNGFSKPSKIHFSIPQAQPSLGKGGVVAIVLFVFVLLLVGVDAMCCYTNHCGILNFLARKLFGPNVSETKSLEEGVFNNTLTMNGLEKPMSNIPKLQPQNKTVNGVQSEVTCDKAPLTKFE